MQAIDKVFLSGVLGLGLFYGAMNAPSGCGPSPKPTPTPTPTPIPSGTPAKGTPQGPEKLLRTTGAALAGGFQAYMAVPCCEAMTLGKKGGKMHAQRKPVAFKLGGKVINTRWPLASEEYMTYMNSRGANFFHFRMGPFYGNTDFEAEWADIGGAYLPGTQEWNPLFWEKARALAWHAYKLGAFVEVAVIDTWYCKHAASNWGDTSMPWPQGDIDSCGINPSPEQERFIRKVVEELGCFGNIIWTTDVEGNQIRGSKLSWYEWVKSTIRSAEATVGCNFVHIIGTNNPDIVGQSTLDYASTHERAPLREPIAGRWTINNEHNPEFSSEEEAANFKIARDAGLAYALWRAGMLDPEFNRTVDLFEAVLKGGSVGCFAPPADDPKWTAGTVRPSQTLPWLNAAKAKVGDPKALPGVTVWDRGLLALSLLASELRSQGHCASGPWADALAVQAPDGQWEELHAIAFTDGGYSAAPFKNTWSYPVNPKPVEECAAPLPPPVSQWGGPKVWNRWYEASPLVKGALYCAQVGFTDGRSVCAVRGEGSPDRPACEVIAVGGLPVWLSDGETQVKADNPYMGRCTSCTWLAICDAQKQVCGKIGIPSQIRSR